MIPSHASMPLDAIDEMLRIDESAHWCPHSCGEVFFSRWKLVAHLRVTHGEVWR